MRSSPRPPSRPSRMHVRPQPLVGTLLDSLLEPPSLHPRLHWLGQAGFLLRLPDGRVVLIDPYLSDFLAHKYRGKLFPHIRLMPAPIAPDDLPRVDLVLCTHRHSDHMDPWTLLPIAARHPECRFVVPAPDVGRALEIGLPVDRLIAARTGAPFEPIPGVAVAVLPSAHETLALDEFGQPSCVGYVVATGGVSLYHSGDCVPYPTLPEIVTAHAPDLALLPVNGRDAYRTGNGVPGNFSWDEAVELCERARIRFLMPHHFGMFAFNSVERDALDIAGANAKGIVANPSQVDCVYELVP